MIDRKARDETATLIRSYMNEEITAFEFDERLCEAGKDSKDHTVQSVVLLLWFYYDDCKDHKIVASKEEWDQLNRLILLLQSDGELETINRRRVWHPLQGVAAALLIAFIGIAIRVGWGEHLLAYALPFGPPSMVLAWLNGRRSRKSIRAAEVALMPFPSFASLRAVRRRVGRFARRAYPRAIENRRIRGRVEKTLTLLPSKILWCMFSPVVLFIQTLPDTTSETRIHLPETAS